MGNRIRRIIFVLIIGSISLALNVVATVHGLSPFKIVGLVRFSGPLAEDCSHDESPIRRSFGLKHEQ